MDSLKTQSLPIEIVFVRPICGEIWVDLKIGDIPAQIAEPKEWLVRKGYVSLISVDLKNGDWENLISCNVDGVLRTGISNDPRLVGIAKKILSGRWAELLPGEIIEAVNSETKCD